MSGPGPVLIDHRLEFHRPSVYDDLHRKSLKREPRDVDVEPPTKTARSECSLQGTDAENEDQKALKTAIQKLLKEKRLSADFTQYELQMIWEANVEDLKTRLNLPSADDVEFLQDLCNDLFLYYDNYRDSLTIDELLERQQKWERKLKKK